MREDLAATLRVIAAATLVDDLSLVTDHVHWFQDVLAGRGLPRSFASRSFEVLDGVLPAELAHAHDAARVASGLVDLTGSHSYRG
jgi:hypothetical protein